MKTADNRVFSSGKRTESVVSIFLTAVLIVIAAGVFIRQSRFEPGRFGMNSTGTSIYKPDTNDQQQKSIFDSITTDGFEKFSTTQTYLSDNLYEKINGKAPSYTEAGFISLSTQRFINTENENLWMEVFLFDMGETKNAFSVYSIQKRPAAKPLKSVQFGYKTSNSLYFVHGKYYVELVGSSASAQMLTAMQQIAGELRTRLTITGDTEIEQLTFFPQTGMIPSSQKLYLSTVFGFDGFSDTFTTRYNIDNCTMTGFFSRRENRQQAREMVDKYAQFLLTNGGYEKKLVSKKLKGTGTKIIDFYGTFEIVTSVGTFVTGVHEAQQQQAAEKLAVSLINNLGRKTER